ncbi:hypothetical protein EHQ46_05895 [Leptospira yanagawae]|uniref:Lipoprotein n=1 Tax=Leptospira yanagawae TaxID=293069 RepID=A0ABY2M7F1_9LEPT|nr:hypothetical protein [Leptospira yanagawae]TGL23047.1 hypothetical protein EHQ46_05895 [Leptospira yanagawae]
MKIINSIVIFFFFWTCKSAMPETNIAITSLNANGIILLPIETRNIYTIPQIGRDIQDTIAFNLINKGYQITFLNNFNIFKVKPESFDQKTPIPSSNLYSGEFRKYYENFEELLKSEEMKNIISNHNAKYLLHTSVSIYTNESIKDQKSCIMIFLKLYNLEGKILSISTNNIYNLEIQDLYIGNKVQKTIGLMITNLANSIK